MFDMLMEKDLTVVDLSHVISTGMPVYPGTEDTVVTTPYKIGTHGFNEKKINFFSHTGTHIDAPGHILEGKKTLDQLELAHFFGKATVINVSQGNKKVMDIDDLKPYQARIERKDFVLLYTGRSKYWGRKAYFDQYPVLSYEAAQWLASFWLKGIGVDMISIDGPDSHEFPIHKIFLKRTMIIIENLANLRALINKSFLFCCLPLKFEMADGSPTRAVALLANQRDKPKRL